MSPRLAAKAAKLAESAAAKDVAVSGLPPAPPPDLPVWWGDDLSKCLSVPLEDG